MTTNGSVPAAIKADEYRARASAALTAATERGLDGLLVFGRGGGTLDRFADVYYLTGHYPCFPAIPDNGAAWRGRGHAAVLLTETDGTELVLDEPDTDSPVVDPDHVHGGHDLVAGLAGLIERRGLREARLGLVGTEVLSVAHRDALAVAMPQLTLVAAEEILAELRMRKSGAEIALLRHAARIGMAQVDAMVSASVVGATEADLAGAALAVLARAGGTLANLFIETTGSGGLTPMRRLPTFDARRPMVEGDLVLVDVTGVVGGYWFDLSRSWNVGGAATDAQDHLMQLTRTAVWDVVDRLTPGTKVSDAIAPAVARMRDAGHPITESEFAAFGHSLGLGFERPWLTTDNDMRLEPGMVLCVERAVWADAAAASHEETVLVTDGSPELLTQLDG